MCFNIRMSNILLKLYKNDDNSKYLLENCNDKNNVFTRSFTNLTSIRNYLRQELKLDRCNLTEIIDNLLHTGLIYKSNPLLQEYLEKKVGGLELDILNPLTTKLNKPPKPQITLNTEDNLGLLKGGKNTNNNNYLSIEEFQKFKTSMLNFKLSIEDYKTEKDKEIEELKKIVENQKLDIIKLHTQLENQHQTIDTFNNKLDNIIIDNKKHYDTYDKYHQEYLEKKYDKNDIILDNLKSIKDSNRLWIIILIPNRYFRNTKEEYTFYKKCCKKYETIENLPKKDTHNYNKPKKRKKDLNYFIEENSIM